MWKKVKGSKTAHYVDAVDLSVFGAWNILP